MNNNSRQDDHPINLGAATGAEADTQDERKPQNERTDMLQTTGEFFARHPAILLTVVYAQASTMGIVIMSTLSRQFGIRFMEFAGASDFLLAALKQPSALVLSIGTAAVVLFGVGGYTIVARRRRVVQPSYFTPSHATRPSYRGQR